jgi:dCTP deaminase
LSVSIWPSQRIRAAVADGVILAEQPIGAVQIQPASMDLRLGTRAYRVPASFLPGRQRTVHERLSELTTHSVDLSRPSVLERDCLHIIPLLESLKLRHGTSARANPKSSSGRLDIFVRLITDYGIAFDEIPEGYQGPLYAEVVPRSFPVIASSGVTLNQIRFRQHDGVAVGRRTAPVTINLEPAAADGVVGYRAKRTAGLVDLVLIPDEFYILASLEDIQVGPAEAAEMVAYDTSVGEARVHYAGFLDPGFGLPEAGGTGSKVVLEVRSHDVPFLLEHGQRVGTLEYEPMQDRPDQLYGQGVNSNYQGQGLKLAKHFI